LKLGYNNLGLHGFLKHYRLIILHYPNPKKYATLSSRQSIIYKKRLLLKKYNKSLMLSQNNTIII
jgi:hypothetical protein